MYKYQLCYASNMYAVDVAKNIHDTKWKLCI